MIDREFIPDVLIAFGTFMLGILTTWIWKLRSAKERVRLEIQQGHQILVNEVAGLKEKFSALEAAVLPISAIYQAILVKELTHFHTPKMDALLEKLGPPNTLTDEEEQALYAALNERMIDQGDLITDSERGAAKILPEVIRRSRTETKALLDGTGPPTIFMITSFAPKEDEVSPSSGVLSTVRKLLCSTVRKETTK